MLSDDRELLPTFRWKKVSLFDSTVHVYRATTEVIVATMTWSGLRRLRAEVQTDLTTPFTCVPVTAPWHHAGVIQTRDGIERGRFARKGKSHFRWQDAVDGDTMLQFGLPKRGRISFQWHDAATGEDLIEYHASQRHVTVSSAALTAMRDPQFFALLGVYLIRYYWAMSDAG